MKTAIKACSKCGSTDRNASNKCRPCQKKRNRAWYAANGEAYRAEKSTFYANNREAVLAASKAYYHANKEKVTERFLRKRYGISLEDWTMMLLVQAGRCWLCERPMLETPAVDHDHATGKVRGLAHNSCNRAFGILREDPEIFAAIAKTAARLKNPRSAEVE